MGAGVGGRLKREGIYVHLWLTLIVWQKLSQHCKAIIHQLKLKVKNSMIYIFMYLVIAVLLCLHSFSGYGALVSFQRNADYNKIISQGQCWF